MPKLLPLAVKPRYQDDRVTLYCADCRDVFPTIPSNSIPMIWTDPPYGIGNMDNDLQHARVRDNVHGARKKDVEPIANDKGRSFVHTVISFLDEAARIMVKESCCCCCCCGGGGPLPVFADVAKWIDERHAFFMAVVWDKSARGNGMGWRYRRNYEFVMVSHRKGGSIRWSSDSPAVPNLMRDTPVLNRQHPNEKPITLVQRFIECHTLPGDVVLDPFMGSGTTGVACVQTGRKFVGIELDRKWYAVAEKRIKSELFTPPMPIAPVTDDPFGDWN